MAKSAAMKKPTNSKSPKGAEMSKVTEAVQASVAIAKSIQGDDMAAVVQTPPPSEPFTQEDAAELVDKVLSANEAQLHNLLDQELGKLPTPATLAKEISGFSQTELVIVSKAQINSMLSRVINLSRSLRGLAKELGVKHNGVAVTMDSDKVPDDALMRLLVQGIIAVRQRDQEFETLSHNLKVLDRQLGNARDDLDEAKRLIVALQSEKIDLLTELEERRKVNVIAPKDRRWVCRRIDAKGKWWFLSGKRNDSDLPLLKSLEPTRELAKALKFKSEDEAYNMLRRMMKNEKLHSIRYPEKWRIGEIVILCNEIEI